MRKLLIASLLIPLSIGIAASQNPSPRPPVIGQNEQPHTNAGDKNPSSEQRGTKDHSLFVKSITPEKGSEHTAQKGYESDEKSSNERSLVIWTLVLAVATIALVVVAGGQLWMFYLQLRLMRNAVTDGTAVANAAKDSTDLARQEFISSHRPRMIVRRVSLDIGTDHSGAPITEISKFQYIVANIGESAAEIIESNATPHVVDGCDVVLPPILPFSEETSAIPAGDFPCGTSYPFTVFPEFNAAIAQAAAVRGQKTIFLFGYIVYKDANGARRRTQFCRVLNPITQRFIVADAEHEYAD